MKKVFALMLALLVACAPMSFANWICDSVDSDAYLNAAGGKLIRGIGNVAFGWVELIRQPTIQANKWEGVSKGVSYFVLRTLSGALEAVTFFIPGAEIPVPEPTCPTGLFKSSSV